MPKRDIERRPERWQLGRARTQAERRHLVWGFAIGALAIVAAAFVSMPECAALGILGVVVLARSTQVFRRQRRAANQGEIRIDGGALVRSTRSRPRDTLARFDEPFGLTLLSDSHGERIVLAFSTPHGVRYVAASPGPASSEAEWRALLARAVRVSTDSPFAESMHQPTLSGPTAYDLVRALERRAPRAAECFFLTGIDGEPIELEGATLRVGARYFDLASPLDWSGFLFHEPTHAGATIYHATRIAQGEHELVFVAPVDEDLARITALSRRAEARFGSDDVARVRTSLGPAPRPSQRVAIDRLFMFALRRALGGAPLAPRSKKRMRTPPSEDRA